LDESCSIGSGTDDALLTKIRNTHKNNSLLRLPKKISDPTFIIVHTAKDVEYTTNGFRDKNKDETSLLLLESVATSKNELV